jgi:UDP-2,3-diacylglucosamine hydrolase
MKQLVFISDLHLSSERPQMIELFLRFADEIAANADELYILGDFLEYWLGDDDPTPALSPVFDKLRELVETQHTEVFFMHGNRDFLVSEKLAQRCQFELISSDVFKITIQGKDVLLMHGDTLCSDDIEYQKFRQMVRSRKWQQNILRKSLEQRIEIAANLRAQSKESMAEKEDFITDVNQQTTDSTFIENQVNTIIHGHTHRPAVHHRLINAQETTRVVLGDWLETGSYLLVTDIDDLELRTFR